MECTWNYLILNQTSNISTEEDQQLYKKIYIFKNHIVKSFFLIVIQQKNMFTTLLPQKQPLTIIIVIVVYVWLIFSVMFFVFVSIILYIKKPV